MYKNQLYEFIAVFIFLSFCAKQHKYNADIY